VGYPITAEGGGGGGGSDGITRGAHKFRGKIMEVLAARGVKVGWGGGLKQDFEVRHKLTNARLN